MDLKTLEQGIALNNEIEVIQDLKKSVDENKKSFDEFVYSFAAKMSSQLDGVNDALLKSIQDEVISLISKRLSDRLKVVEKKFSEL